MMYCLLLMRHVTLSRFQEAELTLNLTKYQFFMPRVTFLGHVISAEGMSTDLEKVSKVKDTSL